MMNPDRDKIESHLYVLDRQVDRLYQSTLQLITDMDNRINSNGLVIISTNLQKTYQLFSQYVCLKTAGYRKLLKPVEEASANIGNESDFKSCAVDNVRCNQQTTELSYLLSHFFCQASVFQIMYRSSKYLDKPIIDVFDRGIHSMKITISIIDEIEQYLLVAKPK